jgi:hypothetical protein
MEWAHVIGEPLVPCSDLVLVKVITTFTANDGQSALEISVWFCQLLLHQTASRLLPDCERLVSKVCSNARLIISRSLQTQFSAAPGLVDNFYYILGYAAITLGDYNSSDPLIDQARTFLLHIAPSSDHLAYRLAYIIGEVQCRYSEAVSADQACPGADVLERTLFVAPFASISQNVDLTHLMPAQGAMATIVVSFYDAVLTRSSSHDLSCFNSIQHP